MKKTYIQPELELLTVSSLESFLDLSPVEGVTENSFGGQETDGNDWE